MRKGKIAGIIAAVATLVASLGIGSAAVAAPPTGSGTDSITLTAQSGVPLKTNTGTNRTFTAYQLTGYTEPATSGTGSSAVVTGVSATKVSDAVESKIAAALTDNGINVPGGDNAAENTLLRLGSETPATSQGKIAAVADSLAASILSANPPVATPISGTVAGSTVTFNNLAPGYYLVVDGGAESKPVILSSTINGITKLNDQTIGSGEIKTADGIQTNPEKKMTATHHGTSADAKLSSTTSDGSVTVGNTYDFELTFNVPNSLSYATFSGVDTPTGMTIDPTTVKMAIGDGTAVPAGLTAANAATGNTVNGLKFTIDADGKLNFVPDPDATSTGTGANTLYDEASQFVKENSGKRITITYSAKIDKKDAENTFKLTLNPLHGDPLTPPAVTVKTHSYSVQLHKISAADRDQNKDTSADVTKTGLAGAQFKVQNKDTGKWLQFTPATSTADAQWTDAADEDHASALTTDANGNISLLNLGSGTYIVKETKAPAGYMSAALPQATVTITQDTDHPANATVTANGNDDHVSGGLVDELTDGQYIHGDSSASPATAEQIPTFVVANINSLTQLPQTGGAGIIAIALLLAVLLIAGVGVGFAARRVGERRLSSQN